MKKKKELLKGPYTVYRTCTIHIISYVQWICLDWVETQMSQMTLKRDQRVDQQEPASANLVSKALTKC